MRKLKNFALSSKTTGFDLKVNDTNETKDKKKPFILFSTMVLNQLNLLVLFVFERFHF
jgi:hypothetical protein